MSRKHRSALLQGSAVFTVMMGLAIGCGESPTQPSSAADGVTQVAATVAQVAAAVTGQESPRANEAADGRHLGFDTYAYPGDKTMLAWKNAPDAKYSWVGYYLVAPCHKDATWMGKRQTLVDMGWGLAVVYVGQQTWDRTPRPTPARIAALTKAGKSCNADFITAERGAMEGRDAIAVTARDGFPPRSVIFLDIERMEKMPPVMRDYYRAWVRTLLADKRYLPGAYVHAHNAQQVYDDFKTEFAAAGVRDEPRMWVASGRGFDEGKAPQDVGFRFAGMWQGLIDVARAVADIKLPVDVNVSDWSNPSEPSAVGN